MVKKISLCLSVALVIKANLANADTRIYPGSVCQGNGIYSQLYGIGNNSAVPLNVLCSVRRIRDTTPWTSVAVTMYDRRPNSLPNPLPEDDVVCDVWTVSDDGNTFVSNGSVKSFLSRSDSQTYSTTSTATGSIASVHVLLACTIPAVYNGQTSHIAAITVRD